MERKGVTAGFVKYSNITGLLGIASLAVLQNGSEMRTSQLVLTQAYM
jgi:hypothetical protein